MQDKVKAGERSLLTANATDDIGISQVNFFAGTKNVCQVLAPPYECLFRAAGAVLGSGVARVRPHRSPPAVFG